MVIVYQVVVLYRSYKYQYKELYLVAFAKKLWEGSVHMVKFHTYSMWRGNHVPSHVVNYFPKERFQILSCCLALLIMAITLPFIATRKDITPCARCTRIQAMWTLGWVVENVCALDEWMVCKGGIMTSTLTTSLSYSPCMNRDIH